MLASTQTAALGIPLLSHLADVLDATGHFAILVPKLLLECLESLYALQSPPPLYLQLRRLGDYP
jgi:hypothetical protein